MAKQAGLIKLNGTIGGITFYKSQDGYLAREKGGVSAERIANDPGFARTRENGMEFGKAGKAGRVLRTSLRSVLGGASDSRMVSRLTREFVKVIKADMTSTRGERNVIDGEAEMLQGFEFNANAKLNQTLFTPYEVAVDRAVGKATVAIPAFNPEQMVNAPKGATHYSAKATLAVVDFEGEAFNVDTVDSGVVPCFTNGVSQNFTLVPNLSSVVGVPGSTHPLFVVMSLCFFQDINGVKYPLKNGAFNTCTIVKVDA